MHGGAGPEVIPCSRVGQIDAAALCTGLEYRINQNCRTKHELVAEIPGVWIGAEVHHQRTHDRGVLARHLPGERIDVWHQTVTELVVFSEDRFNLRIAPELVLRAMTVTAEDGTEDSVLKPARVELLIIRFLNVALDRRPVAADVGCPVWVAGKREVQARRNLMLQSPPGAVDIA